MAADRRLRRRGIIDGPYTAERGRAGAESLATGQVRGGGTGMMILESHVKER